MKTVKQFCADMWRENKPGFFILSILFLALFWSIGYFIYSTTTGRFAVAIEKISENEALDVFRALLEHLPEAGLWTATSDADDMARTVSWNGSPDLGKRESRASTGLGWARNLCRLFS